MGITEILLAVVSAAATLTPLTLGVLNYTKDRKKGTEAIPPVAAGPQPAMGLTVDFESEAVAALKAHLASLNREIAGKDRELENRENELLASREETRLKQGELLVCRAQRDQCRDILRAHGLETPF